MNKQIKMKEKLCFPLQRVLSVASQKFSTLFVAVKQRGKMKIITNLSVNCSTKIAHRKVVAVMQSNWKKDYTLYEREVECRMVLLWKPKKSQKNNNWKIIIIFSKLSFISCVFEQQTGK